MHIKMKPTLLFNLGFSLFVYFCTLIIYFPPLHKIDVYIFGGSDSILVIAYIEQVYQNLINLRYLFFANFYYPYDSPLSFSVMLLPIQIFYFPLRSLNFNIELSYNLSLSFFILLQIILLLNLVSKIIKSTIVKIIYILLVFFNLSTAYYYLSHPQMIISTFSIILFLVLFFSPKNNLLLLLYKSIILILITFSFDPSTFFIIILPILSNPLFLIQYLKKTLTPKYNFQNLLRLVPLLLLFLFFIWFALIYLEASRHPFAYRNRTEIQTFSTRINSFFLVPSVSYYYSLSNIKWGEHEAMHFIGYLIPSILFISLLLQFYYQKSDHTNRIASTFLIAGSISYLFSFGPLDKFINPFYEILALLPGISSVRSIGRVFLILIPYLLLFIFIQISNIHKKSIRFTIYIILILSILENRIVSYSTELNSTILLKKYAGIELILGKKNVVLKLPFEGWPSRPSNISRWMLVVSQYEFRIVDGYSGASTPEREILEQLTNRYLEIDKSIEKDEIFKKFINLGINSFILEKGVSLNEISYLSGYCKPQTINELQIFIDCSLH